MVSFPWEKRKSSSHPPAFMNRTAEKEKRLVGYKKAWEAYLSELPDPMAVTGPANDNVKVNPVRAIIEVGVYFLFGEELRFEISPNLSTELGLANKGEKFDQESGFDPQSMLPKSPVPFPDPSDDDEELTETEKLREKTEISAKKTAGFPDSDPGKLPDNQFKTKKFDSVRKINGSDIPKPPDAKPEDPDYLIDLNRCWKANRKKALLHEIGVSGALHGDVFLKFIPNGTGLNKDLPRMVVLDPANVDIVTDPDDIDQVTKYIITYNTEDEDGRLVTREQEITPVIDDTDEFGTDTISAWEIKNFATPWAYDVQVGWHPGSSNREQIGPTKKWEYPWPPIEHCNNLRIPHMFWGSPDIDESSIELVQSMQRAMSNLNKVIRLHGNPRLFAKGVMPELVGQIDASPDGVITLPAGAGVDSDLKILEGLTNMQSQVAFVEEMRKQLLEGLGVPAIALGDINTMSTSMSGINLSILYAPMLQKTQLKRIEYGDMLDRVNHKLLILMGYEDAETYDDLEIVWPESMPGSHYLERQTLMEDIKLGVSSYTAMQRLGYDPDREAAKKMEEQKLQMDMEFQFQNQQLEFQSKLNAQNRPPGQNGGPGGNNNPSGFGNRNGSTGAQGNNTPKNKQNPTTSRSRGGPSRDKS